MFSKSKRFPYSERSLISSSETIKSPNDSKNRRTGSAEKQKKSVINPNYIKDSLESLESKHSVGKMEKDYEKTLKRGIQRKETSDIYNYKSKMVRFFGLK